MQVIREVREIDSEELIIQVPKELMKRKVEVIISPLDRDHQQKFSKEIENFLSLGGSGCWQGNLEEMRESRNGIG